MTQVRHGFGAEQSLIVKNAFATYMLLRNEGTIKLAYLIFSHAFFFFFFFFFVVSVETVIAEEKNPRGVVITILDCDIIV